MNFDRKINDLVKKIRTKALSEEMTPKERIIKMSSLEEPDRVPVITQLHDHAARISRIPVNKMATDPKMLVYAQLYGLEKYLFDGLVIGVDMYNIEVETVGTQISYPEWSIPIITKYAINDRKDLKKLSMPNPEIAGRRANRQRRRSTCSYPSHLRAAGLHRATGATSWVESPECEPEGLILDSGPRYSEDRTGYSQGDE